MGFNENIDSSFFFFLFSEYWNPHITYLRRFEPRIDFFNLSSIVFIRAFFQLWTIMNFINSIYNINFFVSQSLSAKTLFWLILVSTGWNDGRITIHFVLFWFPRNVFSCHECIGKYCRDICEKSETYSSLFFMDITLANFYIFEWFELFLYTFFEYSWFLKLIRFKGRSRFLDFCLSWSFLSNNVYKINLKFISLSEWFESIQSFPSRQRNWFQDGIA